MSPWPKSSRPLWIGSVLLCVSANCFAAPKPTEIEWQQTFGGSGADQATVARQAHGGGYVIAGYSSSLLSGNKTGQDIGGEDFWVVKVDANGAKVWENVFGGGGDDELNDMEVSSDGGYLLGVTLDHVLEAPKLRSVGCHLWRHERRRADLCEANQRLGFHPRGLFQLRTFRQLNGAFVWRV